MIDSNCDAHTSCIDTVYTIILSERENGCLYNTKENQIHIYFDPLSLRVKTI